MAFAVFDVADPHLWGKVAKICNGNESGCYRVFLAKLDGTPIPIRRLLADDQEGVVYIGASRRLPGRMADLKKSVFAAYGEGRYKTVWTHMVGRKASPAFRSAFNLSSFRVEIRPCILTATNGSRQHFSEETDLLRSYQAQFGETPPLNG